MKRLVILFAALSVVISASGVLYAGGDSPVVYVGEVIKVSGGSKNARISVEDLDVKESIRQLFSQYQGEGEIFRLYPQFDDKAWADMKFRSYVDSMDMNIMPYGKRVAKPVPKNTVPSAKTGLLNPRNPIKIVTFSNKLHLRSGFLSLEVS